MRAAMVTGPNSITIRDVGVPEAPGPGRVVVDVSLCGVCGTDVHAFAAGPGALSPAVFGHEWVGQIRSAAADVDSVAVGDRVVVGVGESCGRCDACAAGRRGHCAVVFEEIRGRDAEAPPWGGFAERIVVSERRVVPLPDGVGDVEAAMIEPAAVAYRAVERSGLMSGDAVVVQGAGPIGLFVLQVARTFGAGLVVAVERSPARAALAKRLGADVVVESAEEALRDPGPADGLGAGADRVFECTGVASAVQGAFGLVRKGGTVGLVGVPTAHAAVDIAEWIRREVTVTTSMGYGREELYAVVDLLAKGAIATEGMHTGTIPLDDLASTLRSIGTGSSGHCKVLVDPRLR